MRIAKRSGLGKIRHLATHTLWLQEKVRDKSIEVRKIAGDSNPADLFTKHLPSRDKVYQLVRLFGCEYRDGRAASAPLLRPMEQCGDVNAVDVLDILPHLLPADEIDRQFPRVDAPAAGDEVVCQDDFGINIDSFSHERGDPFRCNLSPGGALCTG